MPNKTKKQIEKWFKQVFGGTTIPHNPLANDPIHTHYDGCLSCEAVALYEQWLLKKYPYNEFVNGWLKKISDYHFINYIADKYGEDKLKTEKLDKLKTWYGFDYIWKGKYCSWRQAYDDQIKMKKEHH